MRNISIEKLHQIHIEPRKMRWTIKKKRLRTDHVNTSHKSWGFLQRDKQRLIDLFRYRMPLNDNINRKNQKAVSLNHASIDRIWSILLIAWLKRRKVKRASLNVINGKYKQISTKSTYRLHWNAHQTNQVWLDFGFFFEFSFVRLLDQVKGEFYLYLGFVWCLLNERWCRKSKKGKKKRKSKFYLCKSPINSMDCWCMLANW